MTTITLTRKQAGRYEFQGKSGSQYSIWRFVSGYGDVQWGCDFTQANGVSGYMQADTLAGIKATITRVELRS